MAREPVPRAAAGVALRRRLAEGLALPEERMDTAAMTGGVAPRSGTFSVVQQGGVGDTDDQAIVREKPGHRLPPRLGARLVTTDMLAMKRTFMWPRLRAAGGPGPAVAPRTPGP